MKRLLVSAICIASLAACGTQYRIEMNPAAFMTVWNRDMADPELKLTQQQGNGDAVLVSPHLLLINQVLRDSRWTLVAPDQFGPATCTELLVAALGVTRDKASALIDKAQKEGRFYDGNLDFSIGHSGGWICSAAVKDPSKDAKR